MVMALYHTLVFLFIFLQYPELDQEMQVKWETYQEYIDTIVSEGLINAAACR
jgi:hypothetical protein